MKNAYQKAVRCHCYTALGSVESGCRSNAVDSNILSRLKPNFRFEAELLVFADHRFGLSEQIVAQMPELPGGPRSIFYSGKLHDVSVGDTERK
jgi:hypothetical protein